mgnify:FL=1
MGSLNPPSAGDRAPRAGGGPRRLRIVLAATGLVALAFLAACGPGGGPVFDETDEPDYRKGKRLLRQGEPEQALLAFLRVIDNRNDAPESHLEAGLIFLEEMNQPILAIYHFLKFLELRPDARQAPEVESLIDTAKKEFARTLPGRPFEDQVRRMDLLDVVERLRSENERLKGELARLERENRDLRRRLDETAPTRAAPPSAGAGTDGPAEDRSVYEVRPGDTLSSISRTVYGTGARWEEIFEANRDLLRSPDDLRVGQRLRIPPE